MPLTTGAPTGEEWYHRDMTDDEAERAMRSSGKPQEWLYLVYDKPEFIGVPCCRRYPEYVLLVNVSDEQFELHRFQIIQRRSDNQYVLGKDSPLARAHKSVKSLIMYYRGLTGSSIPMKDGRKVKLSQSYVY